MKSLDVTAMLSATVIGIMVGASSDHAVPKDNEASSLSSAVEIGVDSAGGGTTSNTIDAASFDRELDEPGVIGKEAEEGSNDIVDTNPLDRELGNSSVTSYGENGVEDLEEVIDSDSIDRE